MIETTADHEPMGLVEVFGDGARGEEEQESTLVVYSCCCTCIRNTSCSSSSSCCCTQKAVASISVGEYEFQKVGEFCPNGTPSAFATGDCATDSERFQKKH